MQNEKEDKLIEDRGIEIELTDEEDDPDYYSDPDYGYQMYV